MRYDRQTILPEIGPQGQARFAAAHVLVVGAGGLGSVLLPLLAGAGVGHLRIIDPDRVEESNLHRQILYRTADIGRPKARVAAAALTALNPGCRASALVARMDPALARAEVPRADLVVDAADAFVVTYALSDLCAALGRPMISASVQGRAGHVGGFCGGAPCYRTLFPDLPARLQSCATAGVMGPAVAALAAMQAQMVLSVLLGHSPSPLGQFMTLDLASWRCSGFRFDGAAAPEQPGPQVLSRADLASGDLVVELRSAAECPVPPVPGAIRVAPGDLPTMSVGQSGRVVFCCATGLRAWRAARALAARSEVPVAVLCP
ncbi:HesA/MoeB/ThiF family protein [Paracoccus spongiarum]|uniref:HesA/MoeB/ThiF family protein n=1 Tax=Paracoccus spongiarum TaxID=3064387 RepID=A0ABT9JCT4_9RHOB|nr:HesA/MoeB/ThiF family protein [Paracoccus sp. 2205BS29-5]MDP5307425.1 HesA/MoeB/ThiF family protein [Paracoccus sp. 2205BS29-5]